MTLTEKTAAIAATLGLSYSVTDDAAYLLREGTVVGVIEDKSKASELGVKLYDVEARASYRKGAIQRLLIGESAVIDGQIVSYYVVGEIDAPNTARQRVDAADIKSRYTVLDVWRMLMPQSCPVKDGVYHSPFRDDSNPSFSISKQGRHWKDFSSDEGGDCLDFWMKATGGTLPEALAALASGMTNQPVLAPEPPKEKILAVTDTQRAFAQQAVDGFLPSLHDEESVLKKLLKTKGINGTVAVTLYREGSLGAIDGQPVYLYPYGCKIRKEAESSRSTRFLCGSAYQYVWRHQMLHSPHIKTCFITEGESDCMRLMSLIPQGLRTLVVAAPGCSWRPTGDYLFMLGAHRRVVIWTDFDAAGIEFAERLEQGFREVSNCDVRRVVFREGDEKDICLLREERIAEIVTEFA